MARRVPSPGTRSSMAILTSFRSRISEKFSRRKSRTAGGVSSIPGPTLIEPEAEKSLVVVDVLDRGDEKSDGFRSFSVAGLASKRASHTGMVEEVVLLSWLIVLLRTREDTQVRYGWAYKSDQDSSLHEPATRCLSMEETKIGVKSTIGQATAAIYREIADTAPSQCDPTSSAVSLLLSTGALVQTPENKDESIVHLEIRLGDSSLDIRPVWQSENMLPYTVTWHINSLVDTIKMCLSNTDTTIEQCLRLTPTDLNDIWGWNYSLPPSYDFCMHEVIAEQARKHGDKEAISSWDGSLTYNQVDQYSTHIAHSLKAMGVQLHDFVPVCFEKSKWTIVAVLAVMKAGATLVLMDPTLPLARLQNMGKQVGARAMVASRQQHDLSTSILPDGKLLVVEEDAFARFSSSEPMAKLPTVPASALMYIIFTSGSTGTPKGVKISHRAYTSSAFPRAKAVGYNEDSRVLDFASYAFDVSIDSMLLTLGNGGCLCIPSDEDRMNDINGVIRKMKVNYAGLTPSVARILEPDVISSMSGLGLGGEAASARDVTLWGKDTRIIIGYGPCECTIGCTVNSSAATGRDYISIGTGNGAAIWIADPNDHDTLMPVGAVGELLVEGPIVGQGYLNDPEKTATVFINDPKWLVAGHGQYAGRRGRLYKTGDLGRYDPDGSGGIVFVGRKDTQVKLRGQRVELGEIESQLRARLPSDMAVIAEVIGSGGQATLVAFIAPQSAKGNNAQLKSVELAEDVAKMVSKADAEIAQVLPRYMVPTAYIPVNFMPTLISGKTDRKQLRQFGATVDLRQLDQGAAENTNRELNDLEIRLRRSWGEVLKLDAESIRLDDNFFALGGDSVTAMRLVSFCRSDGLELNVANIFGRPTLAAMAGVVKNDTLQARKDIEPFSMISQSVESARIEAAAACGADHTAVEDIYPCTPTQESLFTFSLKSIEAYVAQRVACIPSHIELDALKKAWEQVVAAHPILRSHLAQLQDPGLQQVVLKEKISWKHSTDLAQYLRDDLNQRMNLGESLARYAIVDNQSDGKRYMVWTVHHVLYDGWSEPIILKKVSEALQEQYQAAQAQTHMRDFVRYVRDTDEAAMQEFWRRELKGAVGPQFPRLPSRDFLPTPDGLLERHIPLETGAGWPFTLATLIRGAWALVASQHTGSDDVVFGETLMGRDISLPGVEGIVGPLIATVPVRIQVSRAVSVESYLHTVQQASLTRATYQHMGMQNIRKVSQDAQHACETGTGLVIQPDPEYVGSELGFEVGDVVREALHFNPYPVMLGFGIQNGGFRVCASFDSSLINVAQMGRILAQLEMACSQLTKELSRTLDQISCVPEGELDQIWQWNQTPPLSLDQASGRVRAGGNVKQGLVYPPAVVSWVCNPRNPSLLSPIGCVGELWLEGDLLSGDTAESPTWLTAGSSSHAGRRGKVQRTGDMVRSQEDGSLLFVGRKENVVSVQGHEVDIADLESHFRKHLPLSTRATATVSKSSPKDSQAALVVFVEQSQSEENTVQLILKPREITSQPNSQGTVTTISSVIPVSFAVALKQLDKFIRDSLPSYMAPSAYVVVDNLPAIGEEIDRSMLTQLASKIPAHVYTELRDGFDKAWATRLVEVDLTPSETILRSSWAKILGISEDKIDVDDNFFRLGGDSVLAMKLISSLRSQGHGLSVADIFQNMRLGDAAKVLKVGQATNVKAQSYRPFSTLGDLDLESFLPNVVRPQLSNPQWSIKDVSPVTGSQALDVRATIQAPRTSIQYTMLYLENNIDSERLLRACKDLLKTHDILRTVFIEHESQFFQVVLNDLEVEVTIHRGEGEIQQCVISLCTSDIESEHQLGSSFLKFFYVEATEGQSCLAISLSHAQYDGISLPKLLRDLETLYIGEQLVDFEPFSSYMAHVSGERVQNKAIDYWRHLLDGASLSVLDGQKGQPTDKSIFHTKPLNFSPSLEEITTASLLSAAWALVLARRLQQKDVTFGGVTSGRTIDMINIENVVGPCYQLAPIRVAFEAQWTAMDLLRYVQTQSAQSAAYDFLGFEKISKNCTEWPSETRFFDSIVHHQDHEDFDTMPFAGGSCRVDILNPHRDAASPLKAVSFMRDGQLHVGIVGSEKDKPLVDAVLDELAVAVQQLAVSGSEPVSIGENVF